MIWSLILTTIGVTGMYLAGRKNRLGWAIGLAAQVLWFIYAITTHQYGFIIGCFAYGSVHLKNYLAWGKN